jgi:hypothetical protein
MVQRGDEKRCGSENEPKGVRTYVKKPSDAAAAALKRPIL